MEPSMQLNIRDGSMYPERAKRVEGLPVDPSTRLLASLRIVVSEQSESNHDFAQGQCAPMFRFNLGRI